MGDFFTTEPTIEALWQTFTSLAQQGSVVGLAYVAANLATNLGSVALTYAGPIDNMNSDPKIAQFISQFAKHRALACTTAEIRLTGDANGNVAPERRNSVTYNSQNSLWGKFTIEGPPDIALQYLQCLEQHFELKKYNESLAAKFAGEQAALEMRQHSVSDLRDQVVAIGRLLAELTKAETTRREEQLRGFEEEYRRRREQLDGEMRAARELDAAAHRERQVELDDRERKLIEKLRDFEDRESKLVRRKSAEELNKLLKQQESMSLSGPTAAKRRIIHLSVFCALALAAVSLYEFGSKLFASQSVEWRYAAGFALASLSAVATFVYYLKWNDQWFREHAQAEMRTKRYQSDMIRATWIAELMAEWKKEYDAAIPESVVAAFTASLFVFDTMPEVRHPIETIAALVKNGELEVKGDSLRIKAG